MINDDGPFDQAGQQRRCVKPPHRILVSHFGAEPNIRCVDALVEVFDSHSRRECEPQADAQHEQLAAIRALVDAGATRTKGLGYPDPAHLSRALLAMQELNEPVPTGTGAIVDTRFWTAAPEQLRARWPA